MEFDICTRHEVETSVMIAGSEIRATKKRDVTRKGARIFDNHRVGLCSFVGEITDDALLEKGKQAPRHVLCDWEHPQDSIYSRNFVSQPTGSAQTLESAKEAVARLSTEASDFVFSGKVVNLKELVRFTSSRGVQHEVISQRLGWFLEYKHRDSDGILDDFFMSSRSDRLDLDASLAQELPFLRCFDKPATLTAGRYPVIVESSELLEKLSESLRVDCYEEGAALLSGRIGDKVFADKLSISDVSLDPSKGIFMPFDREGTLRQVDRLPLIVDGVFEQTICDRRFAKKYHRQTTGNGVGRFDSNAVLDFNQLLIEPGPTPIDRIIADLPQAIWVRVAVGGEFTDTGSYSTPVMLAFLVENGEIVGRLPQLALRSHLFDMFGSDLIGVAAAGRSVSDPHPYVVFEADVRVS